MSLSITFYVEGEVLVSSGIFIRENGMTVEISESEWNEKFPRQEPARLNKISQGYVWDGNVTGNLSRMAQEAGVYSCLWDLAYETAKPKNLVPVLEAGIKKLKDNPEFFEQFNPPNGWGTYEGFVVFLMNYKEACEMYPEAEIYIN
jgi:hypothetical protein